MKDYSYIGSGQVYLKEVGSAAGAIPVGNVSELKLSVTEDVKELMDYTKPGGGTYNEVRRITAVEMSATMHDYSPENMARGLYGDTSVAVAGSVTDEAGVAYKGALVPTAHPVPTSGSLTGPGGTPVYVENTDYEVRPGGFFVLEDGAIADAADVLMSYSYSDYDVVEALTQSGKEYLMIFEGLNEARSGKAMIVTAHRVKIGAAEEVSLIGDDYGGLSVTGKLLKDAGQPVGKSQYFREAVAQ